jgi:hypothetical protein
MRAAVARGEIALTVDDEDVNHRALAVAEGKCPVQRQLRALAVTSRQQRGNTSERCRRSTVRSDWRLPPRRSHLQDGG